MHHRIPVVWQVQRVHFTVLVLFEVDLSTCKCQKGIFSDLLWLGIGWFALLLFYFVCEEFFSRTKRFDAPALSCWVEKKFHSKAKVRINEIKAKLSK